MTIAFLRLVSDCCLSTIILLERVYLSCSFFL